MTRLIRRTQYLELLHAGKDATAVVKVVTGMRRCGKSTLLEQYMADLREGGVPADSIFALNFETAEGQQIADAAALNRLIAAKVPQDRPMYIFLDEIQNVKDWELSVAALGTMKNCDVYLTGSNSKLLSTELSTHLSGRFIEIRMLPLSFREYLELHPSDDRELRFREYLRFGALPETDPARGERFCDAYLEGTFNTVLVKDILGRLKIDDVTKVEAIARFLYSNIGNTTNTQHIAKGAGVSAATADRYIGQMEGALLFYHAEKYDVVGKKLLETNGKYYASDLGLRNSALKGASGTDLSRPLENLVYLELIRRGYTVRIGSYREYEVDFTALKADTTEYYQVTTTLQTAETRERELRPLNGLRDNFRKTVLTLDRFGLGSENGITVVNIIDWLLSA